MIKYVMFDFDGTLADTRDVIVKIYNELAASNRFVPVRPEDIPALSKMSIPERCRKLGIPMYKLPSLKRKSKQAFQAHIPNISIFQDIPSLLEGLKRIGVTIGIISSNDESTIRSLLRLRGLEGAFETISASSSLFGKHKAFQAFLKKKGCTSRELLYVGDELRDMEACRKAGVRSAAVTWGLDHEELLRSHGPDVVASTPDDILEYVRRENHF
jgi:phosphoglycolate phosphatase